VAGTLGRNMRSPFANHQSKVAKVSCRLSDSSDKP
jgi:hypothetical protein